MQPAANNVTGLETALITAGVKELASPAKSLIEKLGAEAYNRLAVKFGQCFQGHVDAIYDRCSKVKNILYRDQSVDLKSQYVSVNFTHRDQLRSDAQALGFALAGKKVLVSGTAGAGKTMFMRWATLEAIESVDSHGRIPLYLELRYVDQAVLAKGIVHFVYNATASIKDRASFTQFLIGLEAGAFIILLDAVDEVRPELRDEVLKGIRNLLIDYPKCPVIASSRPDEQLESIQEFDVLRTTAMTLSQIISVIAKLDYNEEVKERLTDRLVGGLYESQKEFLSNPLLATIMLLTFDQSADIPTKLTAFYKQAFEALYQRHDAAKGAFKRGHHAGLPMDLYERIFAVFCFESFLRSKLEFSNAELLDYFRTSIEYVGLQADASLVVQDSMESVCVLQKEGLANVFVHRTFQEYFAAVFLANYKEDDVTALIERVAASQTSNVLKMLVELSPETFEYEWLLPNLTSWLDRVGRLKVDSVAGLEKMFDSLFDRLYVDPENGSVEFLSWGAGVFVSGGQGGRWMSVAERAYAGDRALSRLIFSAPIFDNLNEYVLNLPESLRPDLEALHDEAEAFPGEDDDDDAALCVPLTKKDAPWLVRSGLPQRFEAIRDDCRRLKDEIEARRAERRQSVGRFLQRKSPRPLASE